MKFIPPYTPDFSERVTAPGVDPQFADRWSPRAYSKVAIPQQVLETIFDAARWSPSCYNAQPWRFITSNEQTFDTFLDLLVEGNRNWAKNSSLLGFILARKSFEHNNEPNRWAAFDCGAAWMALSLQANKFGLYTHGLGGVHYDQVYNRLNLDPNETEVLCGFALGALETPDQLPQSYADREKPSPRMALGEIWSQPGISELVASHD